MNSRELEVERIEREVTRNVACDFIDDEAIETDDDCSFDGLVEDGFDETMFDDRPRDSNGKVYVRLIGKRGRLFRIKSPEFVQLSRAQNKDVIRAERLYNCVN